MDIQKDKKILYKEKIQDILNILGYKIDWYGEDENDLTFVIYLNSEIILNKKLSIPTFIIANLNDDNLMILCGNLYKIVDDKKKISIEKIVTDINKIAVGSIFINETDNSIIYGSKISLDNLDSQNLQQEFNYFTDTLSLLFSKIDEVK